MPFFIEICALCPGRRSVFQHTSTKNKENQESKAETARLFIFLMTMLKLLSASKTSLFKTTYNHGRNIWRLFDILPNFFSLSEWKFTQDNGIHELPHECLNDLKT